jgi:CRP-like cAMP-binding protein
VLDAPSGPPFEDTVTEISHHLWLKSGIGNDITDGDARELFMVSRRERYTKGEKLFDEGDEPAAFFLVADGTIDVLKRGLDGSTMVLATMSEGAIVGEMSLLTQEKRSAGAIVVSDNATVLRVLRKDFEELLTQSPQVAYKLVYALARVLALRLRNVNTKLAEMSARNQDHAPHEQIEEFAAFKNRLFSDWSF